MGSIVLVLPCSIGVLSACIAFVQGLTATALQVCGITCCGLVNFEQHCSSKKHLRKSAAVAGALSGASVMASDSTDTERNTTYVGLQAQCRSYCKQVISTELNRAVVELLQQLLFWQERAKSASPYNLAKRKRLVSGLRCVPTLLRPTFSAPCNCTACLCAPSHRCSRSSSGNCI